MAASSPSMLAAVAKRTVCPSRTARWAMLAAIVDLPTPLGPTRTTLACSLRNSRPMRSSMAMRSQRRGQSQLKSASGLNSPRRASARRRLRLRARFSSSSQAMSVVSQSHSATSSQWAIRPCRPSARARSMRLSVILRCPPPRPRPPARRIPSGRGRGRRCRARAGPWATRPGWAGACSAVRGASSGSGARRWNGGRRA